MPRRINLRQIEAFKALMEGGNVSRGADLLHVTQPAMSKLIAHLEYDIGLKLFDRVKKRLIPTQYALRLHREVDRIFAGVQEVESALDALRREDQGRIIIGVAPALSGSFIHRATKRFLAERDNIFCSIHTLSSEMIVGRLLARQLDIGVINGHIDNPHVLLEPLMEHPMVCVMRSENPLAQKKTIMAEDLDGVPFVPFDPDRHIGQVIDRMFQSRGVTPRIAMSATASLTVCEFVIDGFGAALVHPLMVAGHEDRLVVRPFKPEIPYKFQLCRTVESRNARLVDLYQEALIATAAQHSKSLFGGANSG